MKERWKYLGLWKFLQLEFSHFNSETLGSNIWSSIKGYSVPRPIQNGELDDDVQAFCLRPMLA